MCNAYNHHAGCNCGWGGGWHSGGGSYGGWGSTGGWSTLQREWSLPNLREYVERVPVSLNYGNSMTDLAMSLGHSVVFPVICRYCGEEIFLFASPNGGFAIFDSLGPPWPKHYCDGIRPERPVYSTTRGEYSKAYRLPISRGLTAIAPGAGQAVEGTVVLVNEALRRIELYNARQLLRLHCATLTGLAEGKYIRGRTSDVGVLGRFEIIDLPQSLPGESAPQRSVATVAVGPATQPSVEKIEQRAAATGAFEALRVDAWALSRTAPTLARLLEAAFEALVSEHTATGMALLCDVLVTRSDFLPSAVKARHAGLVFNGLRMLHLEPLILPLADQLSKSVRAQLDPDTFTLLQHVSTIGALRRKHEPRSKVVSRTGSSLRAEERYRKHLLRSGALEPSLLDGVIARFAKLAK